MVKGESKSPKRSSSKSKGDGGSSASTRNSRQKLSESFPEVGRRIKVYKNGEPYDQGITFVLNMKKTHDIGTFLDLVTSRIGLVQGAKRLYTLDGKLIKKTDELVNGKEYVASSGSFIPLPYGKKKVEREPSSTSIRSIRSRTSSTNPSTRSKSIETVSKKKATAMNGTAGNGTIVGGGSNGGGTFGRSKSQVSLKGKTLPNGNAKIVTPVVTRKSVVKKSPSGGGTVTTKKVTNVRGEKAAAGGMTGIKTTAKVEKKVEKPKKQGKKKVKEVVKEEGATVVEHAGGTVAGAIVESEIIKQKTPSPSPPPSSHALKSPSPKKRTPTPKSPKESPRAKTAASRPVTAASKKDESEAESEEKDEESDRESHHHSHEEDKGDEKSEASGGHSITASETEEDEDDFHHERTESEGSGRPGTAASRVSRRASLKSNKSVKSHHGSDHK